MCDKYHFQNAHFSSTWSLWILLPRLICWMFWRFLTSKLFRFCHQFASVQSPEDFVVILKSNANLSWRSRPHLERHVLYLGQRWIYKESQLVGCRHSSVDLSAPTILPPWVRFPSTLSMLLSFIVKFVLYLLCENNENKQKEAGFGPFFI